MKTEMKFKVGDKVRFKKNLVEGLRKIIYNILY